MNRRLLSVAAILSFLLAGCASAPPTQALLTYESAPEGATLYVNGKSIGVAPVTASYAAANKDGGIVTPEVTAIWPSGAKTSFWTLLKAGDDRETVLQRPANAPGLQQDIEHAQPFIVAKERDKQRAREEAMKTMARNSARCRDQMAKGIVATNDC